MKHIALFIAALAVVLGLATPAVASDSRLYNLAVAQAEASDALARCATPHRCTLAVIATANTATAFGVRLKDRMNHGHDGAACLVAVRGWSRASQRAERAVSSMQLGMPLNGSGKGRVLILVRALIASEDLVVEAC